VSAFAIHFHQGGVLLPKLGLWLDPHEWQLGPERAFISHAHSDHMGEHREAILSAPTARLMQTRLGGTRLEHILSYGEPRAFTFDAAAWRITLLPAGHIFGSAMSFVESEEESLLYTGDFKLRRGLSAEPCEPRAADVLIMETTYGRPEYQFPPSDEVLRGVTSFCREAIDNDETPVLLGYSLGKSQELLRGLADAGLPIMLHGSVFKLTRVYEQLGHRFPPYAPYEANRARGQVLLCPPNVAHSAMLRNLGKTRVAVLSGWAVDPAYRFRYGAAAAFPLSDHADFPELVSMVQQVSPRKVFTLHGFASDFARTLRGLGFDAQALSEDEQMMLPLIATESSRTVSVPVGTSKEPLADPCFSESRARESFLGFATCCAGIGATRGKLEKVRLLAGYLGSVASVGVVATWFTGLPFPSTRNKVLQLGWASIRDALCAAGGVDSGEVLQVYLRHSDLGETAQEILGAAGSRDGRISIAAIDEAFHRLQEAHGPLAKVPLLTRLFGQCGPLEARYLVKILTGDLRIGLKEGLVEEAIALAFRAPPELVRQANLLLGDIGETAKLAREDRLSEAGIIPFRPVKLMLASPEVSASSVWERMAERTVHSAGPPGAAIRSPLWLEDKYDGIRCQLHKVGSRVALYSRDLKEITKSFHEVADAARGLGDDVLLDGEILAVRGEQILPFAELQRRLGRREDDLFLREGIPVRFVAFDLLWQNGENLLTSSLQQRRAALTALRPLPADQFRLAQITLAQSAEEIEAAFRAARARGNEGLMIKDPTSPYTPGRRGLAWLKLKKALATLDCVVVGAEYGHGKRRNVLSDYTFAVRDQATGELKTIGKAYSGLTDVEITRLTQHFLGKVLRQHGRYHEVEPDTVLEIAFDRLQLSTRHSSGLAMRFPRIVRIRTDKPVSEIDTVETALKWVESTNLVVAGRR
jgi:DNA ligase 1